MLRAARNIPMHAREGLLIFEKSIAHFLWKPRTLVRKMMFSPLSSIQEAYTCRPSQLVVRHSSRDSMEIILPRFEPVERVASDPALDGSELSFLTSNSAKIAWVSRAACLCLKICTIGKIRVTSSIVIRPGMNLVCCVSIVIGSVNCCYLPHRWCPILIDRCKAICIDCGKPEWCSGEPFEDAQQVYSYQRTLATYPATMDRQVCRRQ